MKYINVSPEQLVLFQQEKCKEKNEEGLKNEKCFRLCSGETTAILININFTL